MNFKDIHPVIKQHLESQGIINDSDVERFFCPKLSDLPHPSLMKDMEKATDLVVDAISNKQVICIWGDYDVDGITSAALLYTFFKELGVEPRVHIPDRLNEGYGLNLKKLKDLSDEETGDKLLITVDCGISNHEEVLFAKANRFRVIITDHHNVPEKKVNADAIINPKQQGCCFPYKFLAGVGIAFYLAAAVKSKLIEKNCINDSCQINMKYFLGFVSIGTIADVMPLDGVNRILVRGGFEVLSANNCPPGFKYLCSKLGISRKAIAADSVSFQLAPTINSAGRLGEPFVAFAALSDNETASEKAADTLISLNKKRKKLCISDLDKALGLVDKISLSRMYSIIIKGEFNDGLLGIISSRLVELFNLPTIVFCRDSSAPGFIKGSGRAPENFNLYQAIFSCSRFLKQFGGHSAAAGMSLDEKYFDLFAAAFDETSKRILESQRNNSHLNLGRKNIIELSVSEALNPKLVSNIFQLEPLGEANPRPLFIDRGAQFVSTSFFGNNREHVRGVLRGKYNNIPALGFSIADKIHKIKECRAFSLTYSHLLDAFNGSNTWKLKIHDAWP